MSKPARHSLPRAFYCAIVGIVDFLRDRNSRIQSTAGVLAIVAGIYFRLARWEWIAIVFAIGLVLSAEAMNTAVERVVDLASPQEHEIARQSKDIAAGAVLLASIAAAIVGALIFLPHVRALGS